MENFAQIYIKLDIYGTFLFKKGVNPKSLVAALGLGLSQIFQVSSVVRHPVRI